MSVLCCVLCAENFGVESYFHVSYNESFLLYCDKLAHSAIVETVIEFEYSIQK
jgi:hypothetical protein